MAINLANPVNWGHPLNRGALFWLYRTPNAGGYCRDLCGKYAVTPTGTTVASSKGRQGGWGSVGFNGAAYVAVPAKLFSDLYSSSTNGKTGTVATWFYPTNSLTIYEAIADSVGTVSQRQLAWFLGGSASQIYAAWAATPGGFISLTSSLVLNTWQRFMLTCDGTTITVYLNGVSVGTTTEAVAIGSGFSSSYGEYRVGSNPSGSGADFNGFQDDFRIWGRCLSANDALLDYTESIKGYPTALNRIGRALIFLPSAGSFKSAWARGSNVILQPGVLT